MLNTSRRMSNIFQSTLLMRGATCAPYRNLLSQSAFQSTLLRRGATDAAGWCDDWAHISIHAPHARSDQDATLSVLRGMNFNPRSSCEERQGMRDPKQVGHRKFQSTLLMRGATRRSAASARSVKYFNPRSSCEERQIDARTSGLVIEFQSTLLMRGATYGYGGDESVEGIFQSTLLMRGATELDTKHEEEMAYFNPRSSCEERLDTATERFFREKISIHAPHARSDRVGKIYWRHQKISIHAPHARSDR